MTKLRRGTGWGRVGKTDTEQIITTEWGGLRQGDGSCSTGQRRARTLPAGSCRMSRSLADRQVRDGHLGQEQRHKQRHRGGQSGAHLHEARSRGAGTMVTTLLSNDCLPWIALSGLAPALRGGIMTIFIFDGDTETLRGSVSFRKLHNHWRPTGLEPDLSSWPRWGLQARPPASSPTFCWDSDPRSPCTVCVAASVLQCKGVIAPENSQPAKTDVCSLALQGRFQGALAQGMEMSLDRQVGGRWGPWS